MAGLILRPTAPPTTAIACHCARLAIYGMMCRRCAWRIMTPPPLVATPDPVDRHSNCPERAPAGIAEVGPCKAGEGDHKCRHCSR